MSVYHRIIGRELPCNVLELLSLHPMPLPALEHDVLLKAAASGYPDVLYRLGISHLGRQELGLARKRLLEALAAKPDFLKAHLALAGVCDLLAQHAEANEHLESAQTLLTEQTPVTRYAVLCASGFCLERTGEWERAGERYHQALEHEPADLFAHYRLAAIFLAHNQLEHAVEHHRAILQQQPQDQAVRVSLAHLLRSLNRHREAVWEYEKACCLEPDSWELKVELAEELALTGNSEQAIEHLQDLVQRQPQFPDLRLKLGNLYSERGDDEPAVNEYATALSLHPDYLDCHIALARHQLKMRRVDTALAHFQAAIAINDQNVEAYVGLAMALHAQGKTEQAREMLGSAERIAGNSDVLLVQLGLIELAPPANERPASRRMPAEDRGQVPAHVLEHQASRYELLLEAHPKWTDVRIRYGMVLRMLNRSKDAIKQLLRAVEQNPAVSEGWIQLGLACQQAGDQTAAMEAFQNAVAIRPDSAELHYRLGLIHCNRLEYDLAIEQLDRARESGGDRDFDRQLLVALQSLRMQGRRKHTPAQSAQTAQQAA